MNDISTPLGALGGRFELGDVVGTGGMGAVHRAIDTTNGGLVAIKLLSSSDPGAIARFRREAEILSNVSHPAIVRYVAHGTTESGRPFLAMEWLDGEDLAARLARGALSVAETLVLGSRISDALGAAHGLGIVHRDIKPSNVFLPGGRIDDARVLDFGIARMGGARVMTRTGVMIGTPGYMAPEQARGDRALDARCDVFALGALLYECLTGEPAFPGENVMGVLARVLLDDPPAPSALVAGVPRALDALVLEMLHKEKARRPSDALTVLTRLAALDLGTTTLAPAPSAAIGLREQRWISLVVARQDEPRTTAHADTLEASGSPTTERIAALAAPLGARVEALLDGSIIVLLPPADAAHDGAIRAARCAALVRREVAASACVALVTGRGALGGAVPLGEAIDRAVQLVALAPASAVRIDDATAGLVEGKFDVLADSVGALLGAERGRTSGARKLLGRPSPCVGRDRELGVLSGILDECLAERVSRAVLVTAPAGTGKSRVRHELLARAGTREPSVAVWIACADIMSAGEPYELLVQLVRHAAHHVDADTAESARRKLRERVARHAPSEADARRVTAFFAELLGIAPPETDDPRVRAARGDARMMADQILLAWEDFVRAEATAGPLLLVLEDLHWGDVPTVQAIDFVLRRLRDVPLMVLATARPEVHDTFPRLWSGRDLTELRLAPLSSRASERLVRAMLGESADSTAVARIVERADGNAFFLEEMIRAASAGDPGAALPETVLAMMNARIASLDEPARRVLRAASVFGESFSDAGVSALLGGAPVSATLARLASEEIVEIRPSERSSTEIEHVFRHALVREAAYSTLTGDDRRIGHGLAARFLEASGERSPIVLAEHFERGGEPNAAARWYADAAQIALEGNAFAPAIAHAEKVLALEPSSDLRGIMFRTIAEAEVWQGRYEPGVAAVSQALEALAPSSDAWWRTAMHGIAALQRLGRLGEARPILDRGLAHPATPENACARTMVLVRVAVRFHFYGFGAQYPSLLTAASETAALAPADPLTTAWLLAGDALRAHADGDFFRYIELQGELADRLEAAGDLREAITQREDLAWWSGIIGLPERAEAVAVSVRDQASRLGAKRVVVSASMARANALISMHRYEESLAVFDELDRLVPDESDMGTSGLMRTIALLGLRRHDDIVRATPAQPTPVARVGVYAIRALAHVREGRVEEAKACLGEIVEIEVARDPMTRILWVAASAEVHAAMGDADKARMFGEQASQLILELVRRMTPAERRRAIEGYHPLTLAARAAEAVGVEIPGVDPRV